MHQQWVIHHWTERVTGVSSSPFPYPVDGLVISYDDTIYAATGSVTGHHATRAGFNCSGGVCRYIPATKGLTLSYNYNF